MTKPTKTKIPLNVQTVANKKELLAFIKSLPPEVEISGAFGDEIKLTTVFNPKTGKTSVILE